MYNEYDVNLDEMTIDEVVEFLDETREEEEQRCKSICCCNDPMTQYCQRHHINSNTLNVTYHKPPKRKNYIDVTDCEVVAMEDEIIVTPYKMEHKIELDTKNSIILNFPAYLRKDGREFIIKSEDELEFYL